MAAPKSLPPGYLEQYAGQRVVATATTFLIVNVTFVGLGLVARRLQRRKLYWEDWILVPSLIFLVGLIVIAYLSVYYGGVGRHIEYVSQQPDMLVLSYKLDLIALPVLYLTSTSLPKLSILGLFLRIFRDKPSRYITYGSMFIICVNWVISIVLAVYKCSPISYGWRRQLGEQVPGAWCVNPQSRAVWCSIVNIITDVIIMLLPVPLLWRLQTNKITKLGLSVMFALGSAGIITSCLRFAVSYSLELEVDASWAGSRLIVWAIVEPSTYLIAACIPPFGHLLTKGLEMTSALLSKFKRRGTASDEKPIPLGNQDLEKSGLDGTKLAGKPNLFITRVSVARARSDSSLNSTDIDRYDANVQRNIIHVKRSFEVESYAAEVPHA